jgi:hypothetical protein
MNNSGQPTSEPTIQERADRSIRRAFRKVVDSHKRSGLPIAVLRDGQVTWVPPEEFEDTQSCNGQAKR